MICQTNILTFAKVQNTVEMKNLEINYRKAKRNDKVCGCKRLMLYCKQFNINELQLFFQTQHDRFHRSHPISLPQSSKPPIEFPEYSNAELTHYQRA